MSHRVVLLARAESDLREIQRYVEIDSPRMAAEVLDRLLEAVEGLAEMPMRGATPSDPHLARADYRLLLQAPCLIFYKVRGRTVRVFRVLHGRRNWSRLLR